MKKLVDENGKLFRKINLVDFIVILLLLIILVAVVWKAVSAASTAAEAREKEEMAHAYETSPHLIYKVVCANIPREVAEACKKEMEKPLADRQLMSNGKSVEGYITDCWYEPSEDENYWLYFTIETLPDEKEGIYSVGSQEVRVGKGHIVKTYYIETSGWVYEMEAPADE